MKLTVIKELYQDRDNLVTEKKINLVQIEKDIIIIDRKDWPNYTDIVPIKLSQMSQHDRLKNQYYFNDARENPDTFIFYKGIVDKLTHKDASTDFWQTPAYTHAHFIANTGKESCLFPDYAFINIYEIDVVLKYVNDLVKIKS
jgi:hypothetical protein